MEWPGPDRSGKIPAGKISHMRKAVPTDVEATLWLSRF
jgi:hypothetical protein